MDSQTSPSSGLTSKALLDAMIQFSLILIMAVFCLRVFSPFASIMIWAVVLAIALYPIHQKIAVRLGNRQGGASTVMVLCALIGFGIPLFFIGSATVHQAMDLQAGFKNNTFDVAPPDPSVAEWPVIGEKVYKAWTTAAESMSEFLEVYDDQIKDYSKKLFSTASSGLASVLKLLFSFIIAGIMMAFGVPGSAAVERIFIRMAGERIGGRLQKLTTATIRSVAVGVLGVAFLQALLFGIGFIIGGLPFPGILALIALFLGIIQVPALIVGIPAIIYLWTSGDASSVFNIVLTIYLLIASLADNVLKPMLLGRGVEAPMPVILIGALGGMVTAGFIGLFIGAVVLAVGYNIFMAWVNEGNKPAASIADDAAGTSADS